MYDGLDALVAGQEKVEGVGGLDRVHVNSQKRPGRVSPPRRTAFQFGGSKRTVASAREVASTGVHAIPMVIWESAGVPKEPAHSRGLVFGENRKEDRCHDKAGRRWSTPPRFSAPLRRLGKDPS